MPCALHARLGSLPREPAERGRARSRLALHSGRARWLRECRRAGGALVSGAPSSTDRVERSIVIRAPRSKVWRALTDAAEFGRWFGADLQNQRFEVGRTVRGQMTIPGCEHVVFDAIVERIEPESSLAFRWHPYAVDPAIDYSKEERTLVTFTLEESGGSTTVHVVESGFDEVPAARRAEAFRMHGEGWDIQLGNVKRHAQSHG
ncbi:MAG: SRPBCC family protein [Planctomycetes bacterium]|nr:SRPBCC family protein [Planctomycetota bacterium]